MSTERCATHPDRSAEVTCRRCGSYACYECVGPESDGLCARCRLRSGGGRVEHLRALAIAILVNGAFLTLFGGLYALLSPLALFMPPSERGEPAVSGGLMYAVMGCYGAFVLIPGLLQVVAGAKLLKGPRPGVRTLTFVALVAGFTSIVTCYCAPTSIAVATWGLVLLNDPRVREAFDRA